MRKFLTNSKIQILLIIIITFLAYSNILNNQLVLDDNKFIRNWPEIRDLSNLPLLLKGNLPSGVSLVYRPIRSVLYSIYYHFWGQNPFFYHLQAILIHLGVTILVFYIVRLLIANSDPSPHPSPFGRGGKKSSLSPRENPKSSLSFWERARVRVDSIPFAAALLFGLHPIHIESISYIAAGMDSTGILFFFASFYFFLMTNNRFKPIFYSLSIIFALLALLTNEITLTLPLLIIWYAFCFKKKIMSNLFFYLFYFATTGVYILSRLLFLGTNLTVGAYLANSFYHTMLIMPKMLVKYVELLILPINLSYAHPIVSGFETYMVAYSNFESLLSKSILDLDIIAAIAVIVSLLVFAWKIRRKFPIITFCIGWFFISLLPVLYLIPTGPALSERYAYIPSFGFVLLVAVLLVQSASCWLVQHLHRDSGVVSANWRILPRMTIALVFFLALFYGIVTFHRNQDWKDEEKLWLSTIAIYPKSLIGNYHLAVFYSNTNHPDKAIPVYKNVLRMVPNFYEARYNMANEYKKKGRLDLAISEYQKVIKTDPNFLDAYLNLASIYANKEKRHDAIDLLEKASKIKPEVYKALSFQKPYSEYVNVMSKIANNLGALYEQESNFDLAVKQYDRAIAFNQENSGYIENLSRLLGKNPYLSAYVSNSTLNVIPKNYTSSLGYSFQYPYNWLIEEAGNKIILKDKKNIFKVKLEAETKASGVSQEDYFNSQTTSYGRLINQGLAKIPNVEKAYVKVWDGKLQFFLFKKDLVVKVLVYPADSANMKWFDKILGSISIK